MPPSAGRARALPAPASAQTNPLLVNEDRVGLCATCEHSRIIETARGSRFYLCRLSETDPRFPRYPSLPVLRCEGYKANAAPANPDDPEHDPGR